MSHQHLELVHAWGHHSPCQHSPVWRVMILSWNCIIANTLCTNTGSAIGRLQSLPNNFDIILYKQV